MTNINYFNNKQYPYGFREWLRRVAVILMKRYGMFKDEPECYAHNKLDADSWLPFFMDGEPPQVAVRENMEMH